MSASTTSGSSSAFSSTSFHVSPVAPPKQLKQMFFTTNASAQDATQQVALKIILPPLETNLRYKPKIWCESEGIKKIPLLIEECRGKQESQMHSVVREKGFSFGILPTILYNAQAVEDRTEYINYIANAVFLTAQEHDAHCGVEQRYSLNENVVKELLRKIVAFANRGRNGASSANSSQQIVPRASFSITTTVKVISSTKEQKYIAHCVSPKHDTVTKNSELIDAWFKNEQAEKIPRLIRACDRKSVNKMDDVARSKGFSFGTLPEILFSAKSEDTLNEYVDRILKTVRQEVEKRNKQFTDKNQQYQVDDVVVYELLLRLADFADRSKNGEEEKETSIKSDDTGCQCIIM